MDQIRSIGPIGEFKGPGKSLGIGSQKNDGVSFKDTMNKFLTDVNSMQKQADESVQKLISGEITDVHQVMSTVEEANVAFNMMMEIRNKVMDAYQEIMRIRL